MAVANKAFQDLFVVSQSELQHLDAKEYALFLSHENGDGPQIQGYLHAADLVRDEMSQGDFANTLLYPGLFLLRHAAELALKEAIAQSPMANPDHLWSTHDLRYLAGKFKEHYAGTLDRGWDEYHELLEKWEDADPGGFFLRYSRGRDGQTLSFGRSPTCLTGNQIWNLATEAVQTIVGIADL